MYLLWKGVQIEWQEREILQPGVLLQSTEGESHQIINP